MDNDYSQTLQVNRLNGIIARLNEELSAARKEIHELKVQLRKGKD